MTTLIDRYVHTALRRVPEGQRSDIDRELRASIEDAVDARTDGGEARESAVEHVLLELGDPDRLADSYAGRRQYLIGPELFPAWRRLITMLLTVVLPIVVVVAVVIQLLDEASFGKAIGTAISTTITVGAHMAFWSALVFAVLERTGTGGEELRREWKLDDLPEYEPDAPSYGQLAVSLSWLVLLGAALVLQQFTFSEVPLLDPAGWSFWWPYVLVVLALECAYTVWVFRRRAFTHTVTAVNAVLALMFSVPMVWLLLTDRFFNPEFIARQEWDTQWLGVVVAASVVVIGIWDIAEVAIRAERSRRGIGQKVPGTGNYSMPVT